MINLIDKLLASAWNRLVRGESHSFDGPGLNLGSLVVDGHATKNNVYVPHGARAEHLALLGRSGSGKSTLLKWFAFQDIRDDRGFVFFDLHGDATPELLQVIADEERKRGTDLSGKLILIEPGDHDYSVGLNVLEGDGGHD